METVFSHIVRRRLSDEYENVATDALAFILSASDAARGALMKLLRRIAPELPDLHFRTQQAEAGSRPDMCGFDRTNTPRVFIENKFLAGLTPNQPVTYLRRLTECSAPALLLTVVPEARVDTIWREFQRELKSANLTSSLQRPPVGASYVSRVNFGSDATAQPTLVVMSWDHLLNAIEAELGNEVQSRNDLLQLRALCDAVNNDVSIPFSTTEITNQRTPATILQLNMVAQRAVDQAVTEGILSTDGLRPAASSERVGRYVAFPTANGVGAWFGTDFRRWRERGSTPLWLAFSATGFGRAVEVRPVLEPWTQARGIVSAVHGDDFAIGIDVLAGEEHEQVVRAVVERLRDVAAALSTLAEKPH